MTFEETRAYREHAAHCSTQCSLTQDDRLKKFWGDLADDWLALDNVMTAVASGVALDIGGGLLSRFVTRS